MRRSLRLGRLAAVFTWYRVPGAVGFHVGLFRSRATRRVLIFFLDVSSWTFEIRAGWKAEGAV